MLPLSNQGGTKSFENKTNRDILHAYLRDAFMGLQVSVLNVTIFAMNILKCIITVTEGPVSNQRYDLGERLESFGLCS